MRALVLLASSWLALAASAQPVPDAPAPGGPAAHRLLFSPTARAIPGGHVALGVAELVVPTAAVGLGEGVSLGAGVLASPWSPALGTVLVEPKVTLVDRPGLALAVGATGLVDPFADRGAEGSVAPFAVATVETGRRPGSLAATAGLGARLNVARPFDPSVLYVYAADPKEGTAFGPVPQTSYRADLVPAPVAFGGLELRASERVTLLLEAAALPDRELAVGVACIYCYAPQLDLRESAAVTAGPVVWDASFGTAARIATGRLALDAGVVLARNAEGGYRSPRPEIAPWVNVTVGLGN